MADDLHHDFEAFSSLSKTLSLLMPTALRIAYNRHPVHMHGTEAYPIGLGPHLADVQHNTTIAYKETMPPSPNSWWRRFVLWWLKMTVRHECPAQGPNRHGCPLRHGGVMHEQSGSPVGEQPWKFETLNLTPHDHRLLHQTTHSLYPTPDICQEEIMPSSASELSR